jgi:signal transduction histidine kinase
MSTTLILLGTTLLLGVLAVIGWRNWETPSARVFAALQTVAVLWVGLTVVALQVPHGPIRTRLWGGVNALSMLSIVLWLAFILSYTGRSEWVRSRRFDALAAPLVGVALLYVGLPTWEPLVGELTEASIPAGTVVQSGVGPVGVILVVYIYGIFLAGLVLVMKTALERNRLFLGQAIALVLGTVVTVLGSAGAVFGFPIAGYPLTQVALGPESILWGYAVFRTEFLNKVPALARIGERAAFQDLDDGIVIVGDDTVLQANPRARVYLDIDDLVGTPVSKLYEEMGVDSPAEFPAQFRRRGRTYQVKLSPVSDWRDRGVGHTLVIRDVTELVRRQERLSVLNRVLRHNLRNELTVILGLTAQIEEQDDEAAILGERVAERAKNLSSISEKALQIERLFDQQYEGEPESVDVESLVREVVSPLAAEHPAATVEVDVTAETIQTLPELLSLILKEVVENALVHTGSAPTVTVGMTVLDDRVEIRVSDDGPGIPRSELKPVRSGEETPLEHASSLGLWLITWGTQSLGGSVDFTVSEAGSTVRISVPKLQTFDREPVVPQEIEAT